VSTAVQGSVAQGWPDRGYAWYVTGVLMVAYTLSYIDRQILSMLVGPIKADLGLTDTQIGLLQGFAFAVFYTFVGIPMGWLADRGDRRKIIAWGIAFWSAATAACGLAKTYGMLFLARMGVGVGEAALGPAAYSMIADYFPPEQRSRALGVYSMGVYGGIGLAAIIGGAVIGALADQPPLQLPLIGELAAWHIVFLIVGLPGLVVALWVATLREPPRRGAVGANAEQVPFATAIRTIFSQPAVYVTHFTGFALLALGFNAYAFWIAPYLSRVHGMAPSEFGLTLGLILAICGAAGVLLGGVLSDALRRRGRTDAEYWPGIISGVMTLPTGLLSTQAASGEAALAWFAAFMLFSSFAFAPAASALQIVTANRLRGLVSALYLFTINLAGIGFGTFLTGVLTDSVFRDELRVNDSVAWIIGVTAPLAALLLFAGRGAFQRAQLKASS